MLHNLATIGNIVLLLSLMRKRGWKTWPFIWWAQVASMLLLIAHNLQLHYFTPDQFRARWQAFDIANILIELIYLIDLRVCCPGTFSLFTSLSLMAFMEYGMAEVGSNRDANLLWHVRVWADMFGMFWLAWIVSSTGREVRFVSDDLDVPVTEEDEQEDDGGDGTDPGKGGPH